MATRKVAMCNKDGVSRWNEITWTRSLLNADSLDLEWKMEGVKINRRIQSITIVIATRACSSSHFSCCKRHCACVGQVALCLNEHRWTFATLWYVAACQFPIKVWFTDCRRVSRNSTFVSARRERRQSADGLESITANRATHRNARCNGFQYGGTVQPNFHTPAPGDPNSQDFFQSSIASI